LSWSSSLPVASLPYLTLFHGPFASDGPAEAALVSLPALCLRPWLHCASVINNIVPLLLPVLRRHHFPCRVGAFVLRVAIVAHIAFALPPASQTGVCPGTKQLQHALASLPALRPCCCQCCASTAPLVAQVSLPWLRWRCRSWHTRVAACIINWHLPSHDAVATRCW
jgi:hypothetical protein